MSYTVSYLLTYSLTSVSRLLPTGPGQYNEYKIDRDSDVFTISKRGRLLRRDNNEMSQFASNCPRNVKFNSNLFVFFRLEIFQGT